VKNQMIKRPNKKGLALRPSQVHLEAKRNNKDVVLT